MKNISKWISTAMLIGVVVFLNQACAEVYKWVDENGKVHYSDRKIKPSAEKLNTTTGASSLGKFSQDVEQRLQQQEKYLDYLQSERQERQEKRVQDEQQQAKQKKYCVALQDQLKSYEHDRALWYDLDEETGERRFISEQVLQQRIEKLRAEIKSNC